MSPQPTPQNGQMEVVTCVSLVLTGCTNPAQPRRGKITSLKASAVTPLPNPLMNALRVMPMVYLASGSCEILQEMPAVE
ncbi:MAG TPA: hypothetical protein VGA79_00300 [Desulfobaccales bacterium]